MYKITVLRTAILGSKINNQFYWTMLKSSINLWKFRVRFEFSPLCTCASPQPHYCCYSYDLWICVHMHTAATKVMTTISKIVIAISLVEKKNWKSLFTKFFTSNETCDMQSHFELVMLFQFLHLLLHCNVRIRDCLGILHKHSFFCHNVEKWLSLHFHGKKINAY